MKKNEYNVSLGQNVPDIVAENFGLQDDITKFWDDNQPTEIADFLAAGQKVIVNPPNNAIGNYFKKRGTRVATMNVSAADIIHAYFIVENKGCCWHFIDCSGVPPFPTNTYQYTIFSNDGADAGELASFATNEAEYCFSEIYKFLGQNITIQMALNTLEFGSFTYSVDMYVDLPPIAYQFNVYDQNISLPVWTTSPTWVFIDWGDGTNDWDNEDVANFYDGLSDHEHKYLPDSGEIHTITIYGCRDKIFLDNKH